MSLETASKELDSTLLSNGLFETRMVNMAIDVVEQVLEQVKHSKYDATQFDESTDLSNCAVFVCFVQYKNDDSIKEELFVVSNYQDKQPVKKHFCCLM